MTWPTTKVNIGPIPFGDHGEVVTHARAIIPVVLSIASWQVTVGNVAPAMHLHADRNTRYEQVTDVIALAPKAGFSNIAVVTNWSRL